MPTSAGSTLWPDHTGKYSDPIGCVAPLNISHELEKLEVDKDEQHPLITVRIALARAGSPGGLYASEAHSRRIMWVLDTLNEHTTSVLIMDRTDRSTFPAHIPGPGELRLPHRLLEQCSMAPDYLILPWENPATSILLFDNWSGISSCRDYVILGPWCIGCQTVVKTKDNLCEECTEEMAREVELEGHHHTLESGASLSAEASINALPLIKQPETITGLTILLTGGPTTTPPDALDNSYQG